MNRYQYGKTLLTLVLVIGAIISFPLDWSANHLLNPAWHPHARFHGALLLFLLSGVSATGVWMLWRKSKEPEVAIRAAVCISASFWTPFFYITFLLPGSTPWAGDPGAVPRLAGSPFYPNRLVAGVFLLLTGFAWWLARDSRCRSAADRKAPGFK